MTAALAFVATTAAVATVAAAGLTVVTEDTVISPVGVAEDFGKTIGMSGSRALLGSRFDDDGGTDAGAVYAFTSPDGGASWVEQQKLTPSGLVAGDWFGSASAVSGDFAVIGARKDSTLGVEAGMAYVWTTSDGGLSWTEVQRITSSELVGGDDFGQAVAIHNDVVFVGARYHSSTGATFAFHTSDAGATWDLVQKVTPSDGAAGDEFGVHSAVHGSHSVVGARDHNVAGAAYVFSTSDGGLSWTETQKLTPTGSNPETDDGFGIAVAIQNDLVAVGAPAEDLLGGTLNSGGAVYVYRTTNGGAAWPLQVVLSASDVLLGDKFGRSVWLDGSYLVTSGHKADDVANDAGSGYVYSTSDGGVTWDEQLKMTASDGSANDELGLEIVAHNGVAFFGSPGASSVYTLNYAPAGSFGDPVIVDFGGHRFLAGDRPDAHLRLLSFGRDTVLLKTGDALGLKGGYFVVALSLERDGVGTATIEAVAGKAEVRVTGPRSLTAGIALGDSGISVMSVENGAAVLVAKPHAYEGFTFLNVKVAAASAQVRESCEGLLCDETHGASL